MHANIGITYPIVNYYGSREGQFDSIPQPAFPYPLNIETCVSTPIHSATHTLHAALALLASYS